MLKTCSNGHLMTPENTYIWEGRTGGPRPECRQCRKEAGQRAGERRRQLLGIPRSTNGGGHPRQFDHELAADMYADGATCAELARFFGVSRPSIFRVVNEEYREKQREGVRRRRKAAGALASNDPDGTPWNAI